MRLRRLTGLRTGPIVIALLLVALAGRPDANAQQGTLDRVDTAVADLDDYWTDQYTGRGLPYTTPILDLDGPPRDRDCRSELAAAYCASDSTIYVDEAALGELLRGRDQTIGRTQLAFAWGAALADSLADDVGEGAIDRDQFAACAAGVYIGGLWFDFQTREGDLIVAVGVLGALPYPDDETTDGRVFAFMSGFVAGFQACLE